MTNKSGEQDYLLKITIIGDTGAGKTNYLNRLSRGFYNPDSRPTIGVEFATHTMEIKEKTIKAQIWDTAGLERYRAITSAYYRGSVGVILMYDVTNLASFNSLSKWVDEIQKSTDGDVSVMLIANKCEVPENRIISTEQGKHFAKQHNFLFNEVSAKQDINIAESFNQLINAIIDKFEGKDKKNTKENKADTTDPKPDQKADQSNSILLSSAGLKNIVRNDIEYFTFKFGPTEMKMDKFFAQFLSPLISRILLSDPTVDSLNFECLSKSDFPKFDEIFNEEIFDLLHKISRGESIDINDNEAQKLMLFSILLYNEELYEILCRTHPIKFDVNNVEDYVQHGLIINQMKKYFKEEEFDISDTFNEIAKKFDLIDKKKLLNLPRSILYTIISNKNLTVESEDSLFDFIMDLFEGDDIDNSDENDEYNLMLFLEKVEIKNLTEKKCFEYLQQIDPNKITGTLWNNICRRFEDRKIDDEPKKMEN